MIIFTIIELIIWVIAGALVVGISIATEEGVSVKSYVLCWIILILELFNKLLNYMGGIK